MQENIEIPNSEYRSFEQRFIEPVWDTASNFVKGFLDFGKEFIKGTYSSVVTPLRLPTFLRKISENQDFLMSQGENYVRDGYPTKIIGFSAGLVGGALLDVGAGVYTIINLQSGDVRPLAFFVGANLLSAGFESGRHKLNKRKKSLLGELEE